MRKRIFRILFLAALFVAGVVFFSNLSLMTRQQAVSASDLTDPTLPVMYIDVDGNKIDRMYGYTTLPDSTKMRKNLIPVTTTREITVSYKAYKNEIRSVSYEVTAPDTGEVVENAKISNFTSDGDYMSASFSLSEPILMNREYPIRFTLTTQAGDVSYYARVIQRSDPITSRFVQFVYDFYENCLNTAGSNDVNSYLETDETISNNSYTNISIKSTLAQITWGTLNPQIYRRAVPTITDMSGETCSLTNEYIISAEGDNGTEYYHVWEYYRLRYYNSQMMLLNFNRSAQQIFDADNPSSVTATGIGLGIASTDVQYVSNSASDTVAFVQDGALWEYSSLSRKLARVFSFRDVGGDTDERNDNTDYGVRIIRVQEGGGIDFVVYGYMSRGEHEGSQGVSICHYNAESGAVTERAFMPAGESTALLEKDMDRLCFVTSSGTAYLYIDRIVYEIGLDAGTLEVLIKDVNPDAFVSSTDMSVIAWDEGMDPEKTGTIHVFYLENGTSRDIDAGDGTYIRALGFLNDDLVYGIANASTIGSTLTGKTIFAMSEILIEDEDGTVVKDYVPEGCYVTDVTVEPGLLQLTRMTRGTDGTYEETSGDNIVNNQQEEGSQVTVAVSSSSRQGTIVTLRMPSTISNINPSISDFKIRYLGETKLEQSENEASLAMYYVYALGKLEAEYTDPAEAVSLADDDVGVVLNEDGQFIYERANKETKNELVNVDIPEVFLSGTIDANVLSEDVPENITVLDLSGCTLDQVLYEVSQGSAVVTRLEDGSVTVIVGYDRYNTLLYNFDTGEHYYMGINDSTASMLAGGNYFVTYIEARDTVKESDNSDLS